MGELRPGKGAHLTVTEEVLDMVADTVTDIREAYASGEGDEMVEAGEAYKLFEHIKSQSTGWHETKDKFGKKLYREIAFGDGAYRVTLVLRDGELKLDVRQWYDPEA